MDVGPCPVLGRWGTVSGHGGHMAGTESPLFLGSPTSLCCSWSTGPLCAPCCKASSRSGSCLRSTVSRKVSGGLGLGPDSSLSACTVPQA